MRESEKDIMKGLVDALEVRMKVAKPECMCPPDLEEKVNKRHEEAPLLSKERIREIYSCSTCLHHGLIEKARQLLRGKK